MMKRDESDFEDGTSPLKEGDIQRKAKEGCEHLPRPPRRTCLRAFPDAIASLLAVALLLATAPARAGDAPTVGARVRVTLASSGKKIVGQLLEAGDEVLVLGELRNDRIERREIPRADVKALEVSERRSRKGKGATIGMAAGLGVAVAVGVLGGESCNTPPAPNTLENFSQNLRHNLCISHGDAFLITALLSVPVGALLGAALSPGERWRPATEPDLALAVGPAPGGGVAARIVLRF